MKSFEKMGGIAALGHAAALVVGIVMAVTLVFPVLNADPQQYMAFVADNQALMRIWILVSYWCTAATVVVMALALFNRLKAGSPALMQVATVFAIIWAGLIIGSGNLMLYDFGVIANLYKADLAQASTAWTALEAVETGMVSGNELVGSLWVGLLSLAALRVGAFPRLLNYLGVALGVTGILTLIPAFVEATGSMAFGLGIIVWSVWIGIVMLRGSFSPEEQKSEALIPSQRPAHI
ncbi:MAG: DUF4386 family protein [Anaerolineaceae bacterium]